MVNTQKTCHGADSSGKFPSPSVVPGSATHHWEQGSARVTVHLSHSHHGLSKITDLRSAHADSDGPAAAVRAFKERGSLCVCVWGGGRVLVHALKRKWGDRVYSEHRHIFLITSQLYK